MDARSMMMSLLAARAGLPGGLSTEELLPRLIEARPELAQLRDVLQRPPEPASAPSEDELEEHEWNVVPQLPTPDQDGSARVQRSDDVVHALRTVVDTLAMALGACAACWGTDPACPECGGGGRPGAGSPDPMLFRELVLPAVRRARADARSAERARSPDSTRFSRGAPPPTRGNDHTRGNGHHPEERN
jgi:hypothetical protein